MVGKWFGFEWREVYDEALDLFQRGDLEEALKAFEACYAEDNSDPELTIFLGRCYEALAGHALAAESYSEAAALAENAIKINRQFPDLHLLAAHAYIGLEANALAVRHLHKAIEINPSYGEAVELLDSVEGRSSGGPVKSLENSPQANEYASYLISIGDDCVKQRLFPEAMAVYQKAAQLSPDYADIRCRIGSLHLALGQLKEAELHLNQCLSLNEAYVEALVKLSQVELLLGDQMRGELLKQRAFALDPKGASHFEASNVYCA